MQERLRVSLAERYRRETIEHEHSTHFPPTTEHTTNLYNIIVATPLSTEAFVEAERRAKTELLEEMAVQLESLKMEQ